MTPQVWIAIVIGIAATVEDLVHRRISNWICAAAFVAGLALHIVSGGWRGGIASLLGAVAGFAVFILFYALGGMGGGDIKLMAGFGAVLGAGRLLEAALWTAACGGLFAALAIACGAARAWLRSLGSGAGSGAGSAAGRGASAVRSIPYAPAIAAGVWLSLVPKP